MVSMHGGHIGIVSSTWHAVVGKVGAELGRQRADSNHGPKSKVEAHLMIYKTH